MLKIDLSGKKAFIAGIGDDKGFGWAIAKALAEAGAEILVGTWTPILKIFKMSFETGKFDESRKLSNGSLLQIAKIYPLDAAFDKMEDVPAISKRTSATKSTPATPFPKWWRPLKKTMAPSIFFVHSLANAPEVQKPLLETSATAIWRP